MTDTERHLGTRWITCSSRSLENGAWDIAFIVNHQFSPIRALYLLAMADRVSRYSLRYGFTSTSGPRFKGVHFGSSLNSLMAWIYCVDLAHCTCGTRGQAHILAIRGKTMVDASWQDLIARSVIERCKVPRLTIKSSFSSWMRTHSSPSLLTSKKPVPSLIYRISSSSCRCSLKNDLTFSS